MTRAQKACHDSVSDRKDWVNAQFGVKDIHDSIRKQHKTIFIEGAKGGGCYWWFKSYLVNKMMTLLEDKTGYWIVYSDSGIVFLKDIDEITSQVKQDIIIFGNEHDHYKWCKQEVIKYMGFVAPGKQAQASVILFRICEFSIKFVKEWLEWCSVPDLINDEQFLPQHEGFIEHRHDQAILTQLAYKYRISLNFWPEAVYGNHCKHLYPQHTYKDIFLHHRFRNSEFRNPYMLLNG